MKLLFTVIVGIILFIVYVRFLEETSIFYPTRSINATPRSIGLDYEDIYFSTQDGFKLNGWLVKAPQAHNTLIFLHGNAGNIGDRLGKIALYHKFGFNVFIIDYRGYGKSEGRPSEEGMYLDAMAAYDYLMGRGEFSPEETIILGVSLGGAVAIDLATRRKVAALMVDSTFSNAADMAKVIYPFVPSFLLKTKLDSLSKVQEMSIPKLFMHSPLDGTVPYRLGKKLFEAAKPPKEFFKMDGGHEDAYLVSDAEYWDAIGNFLTRYNLK